jgi:hypothetical protein
MITRDPLQYNRTVLSVPRQAATAHPDQQPTHEKHCRGCFPTLPVAERAAYTNWAVSSGTQASVPLGRRMCSQPGRRSISSNSVPACSGSLKLGG